MKKILAGILLMTAMISTARAELLIEPLVGWTFSQEVDLQKTYQSGDGLSYGGRLGYQTGGAQIGLDYLKTDIDMGSSDWDKKLKTDEWAAFIGYRFPVLFRIYAGYIFSAEADSNIEGNTLTLENGTGAKVGVGTTILPFLDINLEYRKGSYSDAKVGNLKIKDQDFEAMMLSVSFPITLF